MKGQILDYSVHDNKGTITTSDGTRYYFEGQEWKGDATPARGMAVDFEPDGSSAKGVFTALSSTADAGSRDKITAGILAILLGGFGVHKFYLGFTGPGLVFLLVNTIGLLVTWILLFTPNLLLWMIAVVEGILYLTKSDEEFRRVYVVEKKKWF